jgi:hypothetical protein
MIAVFVATLVMAACGSASKEGTTGASAPKTAKPPASTDPGDSPYCNALMTWGAYDWFKPGGEGYPGEPGKPLAGQPGAADANREYQLKYREFAERARQLAPPEISAAWETYFSMGSTLDAIVERYGYDFTNPKLLAVLENPPANLRPGMEAFEQQIAPYENRVCGSGQPPPADEKFTGKAESEFCVTEMERNDAFQALIVAGAKPAALEAFFTSSSQEASLDALERTAPPEIRADVIADTAFTRQKQLPVLAKYGYDLPKLTATGSSLERHVINGSTPDIAEHEARIAAYIGQVCAG